MSDAIPTPGKALIIVENSFVPLDIRVRYEAETLRDAGWQVVVICPSPPEQYTTYKLPQTTGEPINLDGITVYYFPLVFAESGVIDYLIEYLTAFVRVGKYSLRVWRESHFQILHVCNPPDIFFPISLFFRVLGARVIFDHHDLFPEFINWRYRGLAGKLLYTASRITEFITIQSANVVLSTNLSYKQIACGRGRKNPKSVFVVRNGPKQGNFFSVEPDLELKRGFPFMAAYAGVMGHDDGVLELIESVRFLVHQEQRRDVLFVLLGDGAVRTLANEKVTEWKLEDIVVMPGMIQDRLLLRHYLCTADVLLAPEPASPLNIRSTFIKVAEYMAMGKPIVAYDLAETRYTAQNAAIYVKPGDTEGFGRAIGYLIDSPDLRQQMGEMGRVRVEQHLCWERQQNQLFLAYGKALES